MGGFIAPIAARADLSLITYQQRYRNNAFVSDILFPRVGVELENAVYAIWSRENQEMDGQSLRAYGAPAQEVRMSYSTSTYHCRDHARKARLPLETQRIAEQIGLGNMMQSRTSLLQDKILMEKEYAACVLCNAIANITNNVTLAGADQWSDSLNSDPASNVETAKRKIRQSGINPTHMIIGEDAFAALKKHSQVKEAFKYTTAGSITIDQLANYFQIPNVILASAIYIAADGTTVTELWDPDDVLVVHVAPGLNQDDLSFGKTFVWNQAPGTVGGYLVQTWMEGDLSARTEWIDSHFYYDQKLTCVNAAYLIKDATA